LRLAMTQSSPLRYFKISPEVIRLTVILYIRYPLSLRCLTPCFRATNRGFL
jgi:putative transposase